MPADIVIPREIRRVLVDLQYQPTEISRSVDMDQGEQRRRARFRTVPQVATVSWLLEQSDFDAFWTFFEDVLLAGTRQFDIQLARFGTADWSEANRLVWHTAQFAEPPDYECVYKGIYRINARLMLFGAAFDFRASTGISAGGIDGDAGSWRSSAAAIRGGATDVDGGGWLYASAALSTEAFGADTDSGGWLVANLPILAAGTDADEGGWTVLNGIAALGSDDDSGSWQVFDLGMQAGGADADGGGWATGSANPLLDALLTQPNGLVVLREGALITRTLVPGSNVSIANPAGQNGNPVISSSGGAGEAFALLTEDGSVLLTEDLFAIARESRLNTSQPIQTEQGVGVQITTEDGNPIATE